MNDRRQRIDAIIQAYLAARDAGRAPDIAEYVEQHADLKPDLQEAFSRIRQIGEARQAALMAETDATETVDFRSELSPHLDAPRSLSARCPFCFHRIALPVAHALHRVTCSACHREFGIVEHAALAEGTRRIGHFQLLEVLGVGGFGTVWKSLDLELGRLVAVKVPRQGKLGPRDVERFIAEARVVAQLKHPGIVNVYEIGRDGDEVYIVSDLIEGQPLSKRLERGGMGDREAAALCVAVAEALAHAHRAGIVHRDLKPANILLDTEGRPHLTDFGLAKGRNEDVTITLEGEILGTPAYMSPEQAKGQVQATDHRSDIYSLGVLLFEMLTGERPFRGDLLMLTRSVVHDEPPRPRALRSTIPRDLETICLKCLEKDPQRRYPTAQALADDLKRFLANEPILARPLGTWERTRRWCLRQPLLAGLIVTVILTCLLTAAGAWSLARLKQRGVEEAVKTLQLERTRPDRELRDIQDRVEAAVQLAQEIDLLQQSPEQQRSFLRQRFQDDGLSDSSRTITSWLLLDAQGKLLAVYPEEQRIVGRDFSQRDYFRGAQSSTSTEPYISYPFRSLNDRLYKFAVSKCIPLTGTSGPQPVLAASLATEASRAIAREERLALGLAIWSAAILSPLVAYSLIAVWVQRHTWWPARGSIPTLNPYDRVQPTPPP